MFKVLVWGRHALLSTSEKVGEYIIEHWIELCILTISTATLILALWEKGI
jgi:hypothetical protein